MVRNQQVYKTPSANIAIAMANSDRLPDAPEYQDIRANIRAHMTAAMGHVTEPPNLQEINYDKLLPKQLL